MIDAPSRESPKLILHKTETYHFLRHSSNLLYHLWFQRRIECLENLPATGGVVLAINHQSFLDIPLVSMAVPRHVCFVARKSLADSRVMAFILRRTGSVLVKRSSADRVALRAMVEHLRAGDCLAVFPEGTRSEDGRVGTFAKGALHVARIGRVPILPVGIRGCFDALPRSASFPRPKRVALRFGQAVDSALPDAQERVEQAVRDMVGDGRFDSIPPRP